MTVSRDLKPILRAMRSDPRYKRLKNSFDTLPVYQIAVDVMLEEIGTIHQMREIRRLNTSEPDFIDKLIKANTSDQAHRGRLTEIMMTCLKASQTLEQACTAMRQYFLTTYTNELRSFRTKEERVYIVDMALAQFKKYINQVGVLRETAKLVIEDIDKGSWSLRMTVQAMQIDRKYESNI